MNIHSTLKRQLKRTGLNAVSLPEDPSAWEALLKRISISYENARQDLYLMQRALDISSKEMRELNNQLADSAETRVAAERDRLQAIMSGFSDGFCNMALDGTITSANPAAQAILGGAATGEQLLSRFSIHDSNKTSSARTPDELLKELIAGHTLRDDQARLTPLQGDKTHVSVLLFPIIQNNKITSLGATFHDISKRLETERQLRRLALAVEASADAIYITDLDGRILYLNAAFSRITGWSEEETLGQKTNVLSSGKTPSDVYKTLWETLLAGKAWSGRFLNKRHSNHAQTQLYWAHTSITPYRGEDNQLIGFVAVQRDISTEVAREKQQDIEVAATRLRAEAAQLLQSSASITDRLTDILKLLTENCGIPIDLDTPLGIAVLSDPDNGSLRIQARIGHPQQKDASIAVWNETWLRKKEPALWTQALNSNHLKIHHECHCKPDGAEGKHQHGHLIIPTQHAYQPQGFLILFTPIAHKFPPPMLETFELIGEMVGLSIAEDRTREAAEKARLAAVQAAEAKTKFLANMSHEIRTPMNGVIGMMDMLSQTELDQEQQDYVDIAHGSAESLLTIINDILDFSKIEAGKMHIEKTPFDIRRATEDVATLFSAPAQQKNLELACYVPSDVPVDVIGDPTRIRQILTNIIGNAIKFTESGEVAVQVSLMEQHGLNALLKFEVSDTGIGMTQSAQRKLFNAFTQADDSTTRRFGGTGLGLAISKQLVTLMDGDIGVVSHPNQGSTFWFTLPLTLQKDYSLAQHANLGLKGQRVLVVDDNNTNRTILSHYLRDWGVDYDTAEGGFEAIDKLREAIQNEQPFFIAFLDMQMPKLDGADLTRYIKADASLSQTRLVMISSTGLEEENLTKAGIEHSVTKPLRQSIIHSILQEMTGQRPLRPKTTNIKQTHLTPLKGKLLLVEDNLVNQQVAIGMLAKLGLSPDIANNGAEALEKLHSRPYDLVLMDCQMPIMDGFEATKQLRIKEQQTDTKPITVIAMTANAMSGDREDCIAAGMDDYLSKPVKLAVLHETLDHWLNSKDDQTASPLLGETETPSTMSDPNPAVDMSTIETLRDIMEDNFNVLIDAYLTEAPKLIGQIKQAITDSTPPQLQIAAHTLKSASANMGAHDLSEISKHMETLGKEGQIINANTLYGDIVNEYERVVAVLSRL